MSSPGAFVGSAGCGRPSEGVILWAKSCVGLVSSFDGPSGVIAGASNESLGIALTEADFVRFRASSSSSSSSSSGAFRFLLDATGAGAVAAGLGACFDFAGGALAARSARSIARTSAMFMAQL